MFIKQNRLHNALCWVDVKLLIARPEYFRNYYFVAVEAA